MPFYLLVVIIVIGLLTNYLVVLNDLRRIRKEGEGYNQWEMAAGSIFFGGPILLLFYIFDDFREDDKKHILLISGIVLTILQILAVFLLIYFNVIVF